MRINKLAAAALLGISALGLSACTTGLRTQVSRFQAMPAPQGQSFIVVPANPADMGGLEFSRYAELVAQQMQAQGFARAASIDQATMVVQVGYDVGDAQTEIVSDPFPTYGYGYYGWGSPFYYGRRRSAFLWGWNDPFWFGPHDGIRTYTYYVSELDMKIRRKVDNAALFEGRAKARSRTDNLQKLVPSLVQAMFTGFPGNSGETVKITIPPEPKQARAN
ncbi:MAG TPA: DUF4136 domain-containing protein [Sphingomicrobium sp.]|nr:DUF4136 domain-containing protein [Sphingomicrobium sp.]